MDVIKELGKTFKDVGKNIASSKIEYEAYDPVTREIKKRFKTKSKAKKYVKGKKLKIGKTLL